MDTAKENTNIIDLTEVLIGFEGKWIILSEDRKHVVKSGNSLSEIAERIQEGLVMKVPYSTATYSPSTFF
jgi:hypothetical protein